MRISSPEAAVSLEHLTGAITQVCPGTLVYKGVISLSQIGISASHNVLNKQLAFTRHVQICCVGHLAYRA